MKELILSILFILCLSFQASAFNPMVVVSGSGGVCVSAATAIGDDSENALSDVAITNAIFCWQFTASCSGDIDEIKYIAEWQSTEEDSNCGIYDDNADSPGNLLKDGAVVQGAGGERDEITVILDSTLTITKDVEYWLCIWGEGSFYFWYDAAGGDLCYTDSGEGAPTATMPASITCDYTGTTKATIWAVTQ